MEFNNIYTQWLEEICMEQWVRTIIKRLSKWLEPSNNQCSIVGIIRNMASNLKCNENEMWTRPAAYIWKGDEDNDGDDKE